MLITSYEADLLLGTALFKSISEQQLFVFLDDIQASKKKYNQADLILRQGQTPNSLGILLDGSACIFRDNIYGNHEIMSMVSVGDMFAESFVCAQIEHTLVSVQAQENSLVLWMNYHRLIHFSHTTQQIRSTVIQNLLFILAQHNVALNKKLKVLSARSIQEKVLAFLQEQAGKNYSSVIIPFNRQQMADYLGCERSALSAELSRMQKQGLITFNKNKFTLKQPI